MKSKLLILTFASLIFVACGNKSQSTQTDNQDATAQTENTHNAKNSLKYTGTYNGVLPTASGEGMDITIVLGSDSTYTKTVTYVGVENSTSDEKGSYKWNKEGNTITLSNTDAPNQYFVGENTLTQLDIDGNQITGDLAEMYVLKKK